MLPSTMLLISLTAIVLLHSSCTQLELATPPSPEWALAQLELTTPPSPKSAPMQQPQQ